MSFWLLLEFLNYSNIALKVLSKLKRYRVVILKLSGFIK